VQQQLRNIWSLLLLLLLAFVCHYSRLGWVPIMSSKESLAITDALPVTQPTVSKQ